MKRVRRVCVGIICSLLISCVPAQRQTMIQVDDSFDGRLVALHIGEAMEINLAENASTGYQWRLPPALRSKWSPILRKLDDTVEARSMPPGSPGVRRFSFEAAVVGSAELEFEYRRSWEDSTKPARAFHLRVQVQAARKQ